MATRNLRSAPSSTASVISKAGAGCSSSSASWSPVGTSVQAVSPFSQSGRLGTPAFPCLLRQLQRELEGVSLAVGQRCLRGVLHAGDPLGHLVAVGVGHRLGKLLDLLGHVVVRVAGRRHREDVLRDLDRDLGGRRSVTAVRDAHRHHGERAGRRVLGSDGDVGAGRSGESQGDQPGGRRDCEQAGSMRIFMNGPSSSSTGWVRTPLGAHPVTNRSGALRRGCPRRTPPGST